MECRVEANQNLAFGVLPLINTVTLDKPVNLSEPQFPRVIKIVLDPCHRDVVTMPAY